MEKIKTAQKYAVKVWASGGINKYHDWLMSDGSIETMSCEEAGKLKTAQKTDDAPFIAAVNAERLRSPASGDKQDALVGNSGGRPCTM